jgi:hypothetical protein
LSFAFCGNGNERREKVYLVECERSVYTIYSMLSPEPEPDDASVVAEGDAARWHARMASMAA